MPSNANTFSRSPTTTSSPLPLRTMQSSSEDNELPSPPPRSSSVSLQAAAALNAADLSRNSLSSSPQANRAAERRRSVVAMNLNLNDPTIPGPGELSCSDHRSSLRGSSAQSPIGLSPIGFGMSPGMNMGDPHHQRAPSLGEIHQELEQEQEAQVNRLLLMIRNQQAQLQQLQQQNASNGSGAVDDSTPTSERSTSFSSFPPLPRPTSSDRRRSSLHLPHLRSRRSSIIQGPQSEYGLTGFDWMALGGDASGRRDSRDESAFYQAETASLTRENQMLRLRIRELEKQLGELTASSPHTPAAPSNLTASTSVESLSFPEVVMESQPSSKESGNE